jgi:hypothetical protein
MPFVCRLGETGGVASLVLSHHITTDLLVTRVRLRKTCLVTGEWLLDQVEDTPICLDCSELATTVHTRSQPLSPDDFSFDCNCSDFFYNARLECCCHPATPFTNASG